MIETRLTLVEAKWALQRLGAVPSEDSPLRDPLAGIGEIPEGSPAEARLMKDLASKALLSSSGAPNPFLAAALLWLAQPDRVWSLSLFGPGGAEVLHLAFREGSCVEVRRSSAGFRLRYPLAADEAASWLELRTRGGKAC